MSIFIALRPRQVTEVLNGGDERMITSCELVLC